MNFFRNHIIFRIFCFALAMHILNISVDMPDGNPDSVPEDLTINDQESMVELVLEKCVGIENAIAEHDEADDEERDFEMTKEFKVYSNTYEKIIFFRTYTEFDNTVPYTHTYISQYVNDITHPPPQA
jgi:hypothetical protein